MGQLSVIILILKHFYRLIKNFIYFKKHLKLKINPPLEIKLVLSKEIGTQIGDSFEIEKEEKKEEKKEEE